tara:strand:+ start:209 stop:481 length:273 start_codon:yes stop_codon:yes gene_type:complete
MNSEHLTITTTINWPADDLATFEFRGRIDGFGRYIAINIVEHVGTGDNWATLDNTAEFDDIAHSALIEIFGDSDSVIERMNASLDKAVTV